MTSTHIPLADITEVHLRRLIEGKAAEALSLEYKRETYGGNDQAKAEFLADVSSFANARGGDLLIGIDAPKGVPKDLTPFQHDADTERLRLEQMARSGLEPRISGLETRAVPITDGGVVLIVRVPRSYHGPHRVIFGGRNRFWSRSSAGKYEPNVDELRSLFAFSPELADRMRAFRFDRISKIVSGDTPISLVEGRSCLILHIVSFSYFDLRPSFLLSEVIKSPLRFVSPAVTTGSDWLINFDGFLTFPVADGNGQHSGYLQVLRAGAVEAIDLDLEWQGMLDILTADARIVRATRLYTTALQECGAGPPFAVMAGLVGVRGKQLVRHDSYQIPRGQVMNRDQLHLIEVVLDEVPAGDPDCGKALRPMLDHLANAAGHQGSFSFDNQGNFIVRNL
jgi:hypothetical protein